MINKLYKIVATSLIIGFIIGFTVAANAEGTDPKLKIAVIDSGFKAMPFDTSAFKMCKKGHYDFNDRVAQIGKDEIGHGSYVTSIINTHVGDKEFCFLEYKIIGKKVQRGDLSKAIMMAYKNKAAAVNISLSVSMYDEKLHEVVKKVTRKGMRLFVSAGNESYNLNDYCRVYPACFKGVNKNLVVVGALNGYNNKAVYSNHGLRIDVWHMGDVVNMFGRARGTSFAAPRVLGDYIRNLK